MDPSLAQEVRERAGHVCGYCRMAQYCYPTVPFPVIHFIARQHGGSISLDNLALSCLHENTHKGLNIAGVDPQTRRITRLFNSRRDKWERHSGGMALTWSATQPSAGQRSSFSR